VVKWLGVVLILLLGSVASVNAQTKDPTRPPVDAEPSLALAEVADIQLTQIIYSDVKKLAVINGTSLREGNTIAGFTVSEILPNKVNLNRSGERITLNVFQPLTELKSGAEQ